MRKFLLMSSALTVGSLLSGAAEAACIQTPSCSSLGYSSTTACEGGLKCPFGEAWNCTGPNNTNKINSINTSITNIINRITNLENGSGSGSGSGTSSLCDSCDVGDFICGSHCYAASIVENDSGLQQSCSYVVSNKSNGKCTAVSTDNGPTQEVTLSEFYRSEAQANEYIRGISYLCAVTNNPSFVGKFKVPVSYHFAVNSSGRYSKLIIDIKGGSMRCKTYSNYYSEDVNCSDIKECFSQVDITFTIPTIKNF